MKNQELIYKICLTLGLVVLLDVLFLNIGTNILFSLFGQMAPLWILIWVNYLYIASWLVLFIVAGIIKLVLAQKKTVIVEDTNHQKLDKTNILRKALKIVGIFLIFLFAVNILLGVIGKTSNSVIDAQEWAEITTSDGRLTMLLPRNPTYEYTKASDEKVEGYSYISEEYDGKVSYVVKYENWQSVADKQDIEIKDLDDDKIKNLLKENVDLEIEEFKVSNFVSEFTSISNYRAIRFNGEINKDGEIATIQGVSLFAEGHLYTFVALSTLDYSADLERLLNSIAFKF